MSIEEIERIKAYIATLKALAAQGDTTRKNHWYIRWNAMRNQNIGARITWIRWVEANAENPKTPWCGELVAALVTFKLTQGEL